jgi:hypothetical protein
MLQQAFHLAGGVPGMRGRFVVLASLLLLAGCVQPAAEERGRAWDAQTGEEAAAPGNAAATLVVEERATTASVTFREEVRGEPFKPFDDDIRMEGRWEPRDAAFSFHGVHAAFDEWGRSVPAFVFRYEPMRLVYDEIKVGSDGVRGKAHWEPGLEEYLFDAADGRFMGTVDVEGSVRVFAQPEPRSPMPLAGYPSLALLAMAVQAQGTADIPVPGGVVSFTPADADRPVAGECDVWRLEFRAEDGEDRRRAKDGDARALVCLAADSPLPLWTFSGTDEEAVVLRRDPGPFTLPDVAGEALAPLERPRQPWRELPSLPTLDPVLVPPSGGDDWSAALAERVAALQGSPGFARYQAMNGRTYTSMAWAGIPFDATFLPALGPLAGSYDESAWFEATNGDGMYWGHVYSGNRSGLWPRHQAEPMGNEFPPGGMPNRDPSDLPDLVPPADFAADVAAVADVGASPMIMFHIWPEIEGIDWGDHAASWLALGGCFSGDGGPDAGAGYVYMSAVTGRFIVAGGVHDTEGGCSTSSSSLEMPGGVSLLQPSGAPLPVAARVGERVLPLPPSLLPSARAA